MRKEVKILGLSYSQSQLGSYIVVLSESKGKRKLPIVIKSSDAQEIALKIENVKTNKIQTHDFYKDIINSFSIDIVEVHIYSILEGIFYTKVVAFNGIEEIEFDCSVSDGITISIANECPLYVSDEVLEISGVYINDDGSEISDEEINSVEDEDDTDEDYHIISIEDLEHMMDEAIKNEEYEIAAELRDRIDEIKKEL
jgi:uncharacterized protein